MSSAEIVFCTDAVAASDGHRITSASGGWPIVQLADGRRLTPGELESLTVAYFSADAWPERAPEFMGTCLNAPNLKWLHTISAGVDHPVFTAFAERGVQITTSSGTSSVPIAQTVMMYLLALSRDLRRWIDAQRAHRWEPHSYVELTGHTIGVVGMGPIGLEVIRLASALGMQPIGLRRTVRGDEPCDTWTFDRLTELAERARVLVLAVPLTPETRGLVTAPVLDALGPDGIFVNVSRGEIVDEEELIHALTHGVIGAAALDVTATEPLPENSPLWDLPNVLITPHSAGATDQHAQRATDAFLVNLERYARGEPLVSEVSGSLRSDPAVGS